MAEWVSHLIVADRVYTAKGSDTLDAGQLMYYIGNFP